jgi:hypothetical protein
MVEAARAEWDVFSLSMGILNLVHSKLEYLRDQQTLDQNRGTGYSRVILVLRAALEYMRSRLVSLKEKYENTAHTVPSSTLSRQVRLAITVCQI